METAKVKKHGRLFKAAIIIRDLQGRKIKNKPVGDSYGSSILNTSELTAGTYQYSLYVNDDILESRQITQQQASFNPGLLILLLALVMSNE